METKLKIDILMPTYNGARYIKDTLKSILSQSFTNFNLIISDDNSTDNTIDIIRSFNDKRIEIHKNDINLGYGKNLKLLNSLTDSEIIFLMGQDDLLLEDALSKTYKYFLLGDEIGAVTRPYYWFYYNYLIPVRVVKPYDEYSDAIITIFDGKLEVNKIFESVGQLSGLAYRKKYIESDFNEDIFPAHIYPFASITRKYKVVFLKDYTVAVRIEGSQTRTVSKIYDISPMISWLKMVDKVYDGEKYKKVKAYLKKQITTNFIGLVQIKNFSTFKNLIREIIILVKNRPTNLFDFRFWFFSIFTIILPRKFLIYLVDNYKRSILSNRIYIDKKISKKGLKN